MQNRNNLIFAAIPPGYPGVTSVLSLFQIVEGALQLGAIGDSRPQPPAVISLTILTLPFSIDRIDDITLPGVGRKSQRNPVIQDFIR